MTTKVASSDLRVRRTRLMIERAFLELLQQEGFQSITVQQITDRAMVNRATFYDHFADKYALFEYSIRNQFQQLIQSKLPPDFTYCAVNLQFLIETLCQFVAQVNDHCRHKNPEGLPAFDEKVVEVLSELLLKWLTENQSATSERPTALTADLVSWAMYGAARHWSNQKPRIPLKEFTLKVAPAISCLVGEVAEHAPEALQPTR